MVADRCLGSVRRDGADIRRTCAARRSGLAAIGIGEGDVVAVMLRNEPASSKRCSSPARPAALLPDQLALQGRRGRLHPARCRREAAIIHADLLRQIDGGVPPGCHVIAIAPPPRRAPHSASRPSNRPSGGRGRVRELAREHRRHAGPLRQPHGSSPDSSGTTGRPKGVMRRPAPPEQIQRMIEITQTALGICEACAPRSSRRFIARCPPPTACKACCSAISC